MLDSVTQNTANPSDDYIKTITEILANGGTLGDMLGMDPDKLEVIYALGYSQYESQNYSDAKKIFEALCLFDGTISKFWTALAATQEHLNDFEAASESYTYGALTGGLKDPEPVLKVAQCLLKANKKEEAIGALDLAVVLGDSEDEKVLEIREKSKKLRELLDVK